jgi:PD-(D/E)XK nuclease superfamily
MMIYTDRSRIETYEHCPRKRFWQYEYAGTGLEKSDDLKLDARIGTWVHNGIENGLLLNPGIARSHNSKAAVEAGLGFIYECSKLIDWPTASEQQKFDLYEGGQIVTALVYAWLKLKAPRLLEDGEVLGVEKELTVDFEVPTIAGNETVRLMARPDIIWRRKSDGAIFIRNLKTVRQADDRWREKWALDMQTLSEPLAVDAWLPNQFAHTGVLEDNCGGVIIDGLVTGKITSAKSQFNGLYHHNNHLIYAFRQEMPNGEYLFRPDYKYGLQKVAVADTFPGGIIAWIDKMIANSLSFVEEHIIELPPIIRSDYQIERWKKQTLAREVRINRRAKNTILMLSRHHPLYSMDYDFPMHTSNGNCIYPGKCMAFDLCHGSAAGDPLNSGYRVRTPNHPKEGEQ